jgi:hypothetical protein
MKYGKYVFNTKEQAEEKIADLSTTNEAGEVLGHPHDIVKIGHELITQAEIDDEGNVVTEAVYSDKFLVDVLWNTPMADHPYGWKTYSVEPNGTKHRFVGVDFNANKF